MKTHTADILMLVWLAALLALLVMLAACAPGTITHDERAEWSFKTIPLNDHASAVLIVPREGSTKQQTRVVQPQNPAAWATLTTPNVSATVPPAFKPAAPPTPVSLGLGKLVWFGGVLILVGVIGLALRFTPFGAVVPIGVSILVATAGGLLIAYAEVLDSAPWWVTALCVAAVIGAGVFVAMRDNWKKIIAAQTTRQVNVNTTGAS